jgi:transposase
MKDARSLDQSAQEIIRIKGVQSLIDGATQEQVAKTFGVTRQAVGKWWSSYKMGGMRSLEKKSRRPKSADEPGDLMGWQCASSIGLGNKHRRVH